MAPYRLKRGSWRPARMRRVDHMVVSAYLLFIAYVRGLDYALGNDRWGARDFMLAAFPAWFWGLGFILGAAVLTFGMLSKRHFFVWLGHGWLAIAYGVNALALAIVSLGDAQLDGIRGYGAASFVALIHLFGWLRTGPVPLRRDPSVEAVVEATSQDRGGSA